MVNKTTMVYTASASQRSQLSICLPTFQMDPSCPSSLMGQFCGHQPLLQTLLLILLLCATPLMLIPRLILGSVLLSLIHYVLFWCHWTLMFLSLISWALFQAHQTLLLLPLLLCKGRGDHFMLCSLVWGPVFWWLVGFLLFLSEKSQVDYISSGHRGVWCNR